MSFSEKMRDSLGAEGAKVEVLTPTEGVQAGASASTTVRFVGGTEPAQIDALIMRVVQARRHWVESGGRELSEEQVQGLDDRANLMPAWTRQTVAETRVEVGQIVEPGDTKEVVVDVTVPEGCERTSPAVTVTVNAQADIKGQIDPTANGRLTVA